MMRASLLCAPLNHFERSLLPMSQSRWFIGQAFVDFDFARRCSKGPFIATQPNSTEIKSTCSSLQFSWVVINGPLGVRMTGVALYAYAGFLS